MFDDWLTSETLPLIWFTLIGLLLAGYCILDGFDLGVGILHPFVAQDDLQRRLSMNSIGPLWDGNEVWLVTLGGALFAMFPYAYATIFSAFYTAFMMLLFALIFRAVSMEFRGKMSAPWATRFWDYSFFAGSFLASFLFGVAGGNLIQGMLLDDRGNFTGSLLDQLEPYCLTTGMFMVALFATHGAIFLHMKLTGDFQRRIGTAMKVCWILASGLYVVITAWTLTTVPQATDNFDRHTWLWIVPLTNAICVATTGWMIWRQKAFFAFLCNAATIVSLVALLASALFPNIINAKDPANSLRIEDAASSDTTLKIGLLVVAIGLPFVITYTTVIYWTFRGKTELGSHSY